jgi:hypothetical protein
MNCNICKNKINNVFLNLGKTPPANSLIINKNRLSSEKKFNLIVYLCKKCWLVQTKQIVSKKIFFNNKYPYYSSVSESWLKHSKSFVSKIIRKLKLNKFSKVIEIASNDGYLLQYFKKKQIPCLGIEPSKNTAIIAQKKGIKVIKKFFSYELSKKISPKVDLVICNNVLAHVPNLMNFVKGLENTINQKGIITIEFPHLKNLIKKIQFDTIYHEHYFYFSLIALEKIFTKCNLKIFNVDKISTHGGSLRVYLCKKNNQIKISKTVKETLDDEINFGLKRIKTYLLFKKKVQLLKKRSKYFIKKCIANNKVIDVYGAAAKGITFLNYLKVSKNQVRYAYDASKFKINKYLPLSHIPIYSPDKIIKYKPDYLLILPWNIQREIKNKLNFVKSWKCKLVTLIPIIKIHK